MKFWDTSALVALFLPETASARVERWLRDDTDVVVWTLTRVELCSALARRRRIEPRAARYLLAVRRDVVQAWERWTEVTAVELVRRHAERLVETHPITAADALQIAAALVAAEDHPESLDFVTLDQQQARVADREGFRVLGV
ncbi:MAG TPA: type II toxin-antitoxin system VapC family toxin [Methylomirabilota bacterium]|nr:type II toxin-antitoxin system VapC family toxin [Methylomirabilota bacterium]